MGFPPLNRAHPRYCCFPAVQQPKRILWICMSARQSIQILPSTTFMRCLLVYGWSLTFLLGVNKTCWMVMLILHTEYLFSSHHPNGEKWCLNHLVLLQFWNQHLFQVSVAAVGAKDFIKDMHRQLYNMHAQRAWLFWITKCHWDKYISCCQD